MVDSEAFRRRSSELNRTTESNLLDFNEDRFYEETKGALFNFNPCNQIQEVESSASSISMDLGGRGADLVATGGDHHHQRRGSEAHIEGFL